MPPPLAEPGDEPGPRRPVRREDTVSRVRVSAYVPDAGGRDLPRLPPAWTSDDDQAVDDAIDALRGGDTTAVLTPPPRPAPRVDDGAADVERRLAPPLAAPPLGPPPRLPRAEPAASRPPAPPAAPPAGRPPLRRRTPTGPRAGEGATRIADRYDVVERIGQGGMGKVYKVVHAQLGKVFALKLIGEELAATPAARELFYREARLASSLSHPHIASVVDFGEDPNFGLFMVMEFVEGEPLNRLLHREQRLAVRPACELIWQIAEALRYIHANDIVHCDIKTENILVCEGLDPKTQKRRQTVKLLDFGLARSLSSARQTSSLSGTPHYVAPERIRGEPASPASDVYGVGILFYELITGQVPWDGNVAHILAGHLEHAPTPPSRLVDGLDPAVETLILHALAKTPAERHRDFAAFLYELRTVMDMLGFGLRGRGPRRRVVIERSKNERDAMVQVAFEGCRLPLALVSPTGLIVVANPAFARFVMGAEADVEGLTVQATPLVTAWDAFDADLARACGGKGVRRILEIDVGPDEVRRMLLWLDPGAGGHAILGVQPLDV